MGIPGRLRRVRDEPVGGRSRFWLHGGPGIICRGQGVYQQDKAKADAINVDTMIKWNKALRARQKALREENRKKAIKEEAAREVRVERMELRDGTTLNNLLLQIFDTDPGVVQSGRAKNVISASAIREIPFEWDSEAITFCIDQMTASDALPPLLMRPTYVDERSAAAFGRSSRARRRRQGNRLDRDREASRRGGLELSCQVLEDVQRLRVRI